MALARPIRAVLSWICWTLAVVVALLTAGAFAGGGVLCQSGDTKACTPQTWMLVAGIGLTLAFGVAGAVLWKPRPPAKRPGRFPWDYQQ